MISSDGNTLSIIFYYRKTGNIIAGHADFSVKFKLHISQKYDILVKKEFLAIRGDILIPICEYINFLPSSDEPLSADVFFVRGDKKTYIYDVGANEQSFKEIESVPGEKAVILSHFHPDHIANMTRLRCDEIYLGRKTFEKLGRGVIVSDKIVIEDGLKLEIARFPSVHAKGSLVLTVNSEYTLIGDLYYCAKDCNKNIAREMLTAMKRLDTRYFVPSHYGESPVIEKNRLICELEDYFFGEKINERKNEDR